MRPDEHKKKSSAKYKKKHGMQKDDNTNTTKKTDALQSKEGKIQTKKLSSVQEDVRKVDSQPNSTVEETLGRKFFSKRIIVNNWEKYDDTDETEEQIGADFNELLMAAGGASSHMTLNSEKGWNLDQDLDEVLSIDVEKLADSLSQLAFCDRLGLDESQFDPSLLELLNGGSYNSQAENGAVPLHSFSFRDYNFDFQNPRNTNSSKKNKDPPPKSSDNILMNSVVLQDENADEHKHSSQSASSIEQNQLADNGPLCNPSAINSQEKHESKDFSPLPSKSSSPSLISFSKPNPTQLTQALPVRTKPTVTKDLESDLDDLLSGTASVPYSHNSQTKIEARKTQSNYTASKPVVKDTKGDSAKEQDDLEEWLDSII